MGFNTPTKEGRARAGGSDFLTCLAGSLVSYVSFSYTSVKKAHLAEPAKLARIPVGQGPSSGETESESTNQHGPGVSRGCLNAINSKGREGCDGFGGVRPLREHCLDEAHKV